MKALKYLSLGILLGMAVGFGAGLNVGKGKPMLSNPFASYDLGDRLQDSGSELVRKSGEAIEDTGKAIKKSID